MEHRLRATQIYATDLDAVSADGWGNRHSRGSCRFHVCRRSRRRREFNLEELELRGGILWFKVQIHVTRVVRAVRGLWQQPMLHCGRGPVWKKYSQLSGELSLRRMRTSNTWQTFGHRITRYAYRRPGEAGFDGRRQWGATRAEETATT